MLPALGLDFFIFVQLDLCVRRFCIWGLNPEDTEGQLCCSILYKGLEHLQILVAAESRRLEPIPRGYRGMTVFLFSYQWVSNLTFLLWNVYLASSTQEPCQEEEWL